MTDVSQRRVHGRRKGRPLNAARKDALNRLLPVLSIPAERLTEDGTLAPSSLFAAPYQELWLEVGFGSGEHLSALMRRHPENAYLGAEPYLNGMAAFLKDISSHPPHYHPPHPSPPPGWGGDCCSANVRVLMDDAMMSARSLEDGCLDGIYVLNPDPWHKKRHHKRRIISRENLDVFARILKPGGQLIMSSDVPDMTDWMVTQAVLHPAFEWTARRAEDWRVPPADWIPTAYERKGAKGATVMSYLFFERRS